MNKIIVFNNKIKNTYNINTDIVIHTNMETLQKLQKGYSIARYGDGEFLLMINKDMLYESFNESLKNRLIQVLTQNDNDKLLLGIPNMYFRHDVYVSQTIRGKQLYIHWNNNIRLFVPENMHLFNRKEYYSSFFTQLYAYSNEENKINFTELKKVWNNKNIVLYMNEFVYKNTEDIRKKIFSNTISVIHEVVPSTKAWEKYDDILNSVKKYNIDTLIIVCCGATATIMAYDVSKLGYQIIDLGQFIEDINYDKNIL
jgi:hypothetical protein